MLLTNLPSWLLRHFKYNQGNIHRRFDWYKVLLAWAPSKMALRDSNFVKSAILYFYRQKMDHLVFNMLTKSKRTPEYSVKSPSALHYSNTLMAYNWHVVPKNAPLKCVISEESHSDWFTSCGWIQHIMRLSLSISWTNTRSTLTWFLQSLSQNAHKSWECLCGFPLR